MLNPKQAEAALKKFRVKGWQKRRKAAVAALPAPLNELALALLGEGRFQPYSETRAGRQGYEEAPARLEALPPEERRAIFEARFPRLAEQVEGFWQRGGLLPYQEWEGPPFRAPEHPELTLERRRDALTTLAYIVEGYEEEIAWFATWAPHLSDHEALAGLFAAAIEAGGPEGEAVWETLLAAARGEAGGVVEHATGALLMASRPEGWAAVGQLLVGARREEGLRATILEQVGRAHPGAFRFMLRLILEQDLARFPATVETVHNWLGYDWGGDGGRKAVNQLLSHLVSFLDDPAAREEALAEARGEPLFLALWALAFEEAYLAIGPASRLLADSNPERRLLAARLLGQLELPAAREAMLSALEDEDLRVVACAAEALWSTTEEEDDQAVPHPSPLNPQPSTGEPDLFERLERTLPRLPARPVTFNGVIWPWWSLTFDRHEVAGLLRHQLGTRPATRLIPFLPLMNAYERSEAAGMLAAMKPQPPQARAALLDLAGDLSGEVREEALKGLGRGSLAEAEAIQLEGYLTRKGSQLRTDVLARLLKQADTRALESADRLLAAGNRLQRLAGLEILRELAAAGRVPDRCRERAAAYSAAAAGKGAPAEEEQQHLAVLLGGGETPLSLQNALGLADPQQRTQPPLPVRHDVFSMRAALACLQSLDDLVHAHRKTRVTVLPETGEDDEGTHEVGGWHDWEDEEEDWGDETDLDPDLEDEDVPEGPREERLGTAGDEWVFPSPRPQLAREEDAARLPLRELWERWWEDRPAELRDADGCELWRAQAYLELAESDDFSRRHWLREVQNALLEGSGAPDLKLRSAWVVQSVVAWLARLYPTPGAADFLLDTLETACALIPEEHRLRPPRRNEWELDWRDYGSPVTVYRELARSHRALCPEAWTAARQVRFWQLLRWIDEPTGATPAAGRRRGAARKRARRRPDLEEVLAAFEAGGATEADLFDHLLGGSEEDEETDRAGELEFLSRPRPPRRTARLLARYPFLGPFVERCRERVLEVELARGETPTPASQVALALQHAGGMANLVRLLAAFGSGRFVRKHEWEDRGRDVVFSHLIRATWPEEGDSYAAFAAWVADAKIPPRRLADLAVYAPQWASHVEQALAWPELASAAWWILAHTRDRDGEGSGWSRRQWQAAVSEHTPLSVDDLLEGGVDVAWFQRVYQALGPERWTTLDEAAKFASSTGGYKRAQLFADAMAGRIARADLVTRVRSKRHQDSVRALGLLPLVAAPVEGSLLRVEGPDRPDPSTLNPQPSTGAADLLERYQILQEFLRTSKEFGAQRRENEGRAVRTGLANLARTAGYPDPVRLEWAMEARAAADLAGGGIAATVEGVEVSLGIDALGEPELAVVKQGRRLRSLPAGVRKHPEVARLRERLVELKRQGTRVRRSLEEAMCRGDRFTGAELRNLRQHPLLGPLLERLVLVEESGGAGYPAESGNRLRDAQGRLHSVRDDTALRIAHPHDLRATGEWARWQAECFRSERIQPFKQVFRELYPLTPAEREARTVSRRYEGQQVNPRQAMALLASRGWINHPEEGVRRTFHEAGLTAWLDFAEGYFSLGERDCLTVQTVRFCPRRTPTNWVSLRFLPLEEVPPLLFSEVMRDVDLVVSVAHRGGADPEASASTVEMRGSLVEETAALLKLANVRVEERRVLIEGQLSHYSIHLGSGVIHRQPGGYLCIVPVQTQDRGRLFLPFADDDPKTAEILSKVLLLARDHEIRDPSILGQLRVG